MKFSHKLSDAIHILAYLDIFKDGDRSSKQIAASIEANPSVVRSLMSDLRRAGLIQSQQGAPNATLAKDPANITLLDVYHALNMNHDLLHIDPKTNPNCLVGANIQDTLNEIYAQVQIAAETQLQATTLQDVITGILHRHQNKH